MPKKITNNDINAIRKQQKNLFKENLTAIVLKAVKDAINENFSDWKSKNVPQFDFQKFAEATIKFLTPLNALIKNGEISEVHIATIVNKKAYGAYRISKTKMIEPNEVANIAVRTIKEQVGDKLFVEAMDKCYFVIEYENDSNFAKWILSELEPAQPNKIIIKGQDGKSSVIVANIKSDRPVSLVYVTLKELYENLDQIVDFFS